jgi:hypothetical protein
LISGTISVVQNNTDRGREGEEEGEKSRVLRALHKV